MAAFPFLALPDELQILVLSHDLPRDLTFGEFRPPLTLSKEFRDAYPTLGCISKQVRNAAWSAFLEQNTLAIRHRGDIPGLLQRLERGPSTFEDIRSLDYLNDHERGLRYNILFSSIPPLVNLAAECSGLQELTIGLHWETLQHCTASFERFGTVPDDDPILELMQTRDIIREWQLASLLDLKRLKMVRLRCWWRSRRVRFHISEVYLRLYAVANWLEKGLRERWGGDIKVEVAMTETWSERNW